MIITSIHTASIHPHVISLSLSLYYIIGHHSDR